MVNLDREFDIVVYGATGFTGKLVCKHLKDNYLKNQDDSQEEDKIKLAIGGRSRQKLKDLKTELGLSDGVGTFVVDSFDGEGLKEMCKKSKAVVTLVGPYHLYGDALIEACVESGTHYFDLTAESCWVSHKISRLDSQAKDSKTVIIPSCGFDSVPADLNVMLASEKMKSVAGEGTEMGLVTSGVRVAGGVSGGTLASILNLYEQSLSTLMESTSCYTLSPVKGHQKSSGTWVTREPGLVGGFFLMSPANVPLVQRTWGILESTKDDKLIKKRYGKRFSYNEYLITKGFVSALGLSFIIKFFGLALIFRPIRSVVRMLGPKSGEGPDEKARNSGRFQYITTAHSVKDDVQVRITMNGTKDPGYGWTSICISECALAVIKNYDELPPLAKGGGFLTPATGLGNVLVERLEGLKAIKIKKEVLRKNQEIHE